MDDIKVFPLVTVAGREFYIVPRSYFGALLLQNGSDEPILFPVLKEDDKLSFAAGAAFEREGKYVRSGIALHETYSAKPTNHPGLTAMDVNFFSEIDWHGECAQVLSAHGWTGAGGTISDEMIERIVEAEGEDPTEEAKSNFGDNWKPYLLELAAKHFTEPFSRVWYAANMMSLYYARNEELRLGLLWSEYQLRKSYEVPALKHLDVIDQNRSNGSNGGRARQKRRRYEVLDKIGLSRLKELSFKSDREFVRIIKGLASAWEKEHGETLFTQDGKPLSKAWYEEWISEFRSRAATSTLEMLTITK